MSTVAELLIKLGMDDGGLDKGMASSQSKLKSWGENLRSVGTKLTAGVTLPLVGAGIAAINWASDQAEAANKVDSVFKGSAQSVKDWANDQSNTLLITKTEALDYVGTLGNMLTAQGLTTDSAAEMSEQWVGLAQDFSSFNNIPVDQALTAIRAGIVGEYEPLRSLGVVLDDATVKQKAMEMGLYDGTGALTGQARALAVNELLMEQTTNVQGDAAKTAKGFANQMRILKSNLKDTAAEIGQRFLPYAERFQRWLLDLLDAFDNLDPKWQNVILAVLAFAAALGPLLLMLGFMLPAIAALGTVIGVLLSPIGLLIIAIAALIGLGIYAWANDLWGVRDAVNAVADALVTFATGLNDLRKYLQAVWEDGDTLNDWLTYFPDALRPVIMGIGDFVNALHDFRDMLGPVAGDIGDVFQAIGEGNWAEALYESRDALLGLGSAITALSADTIGLIADGLQNLADKGGILSPALDTLAASTRNIEQGIRFLSGALGQFMAGDYSGGILTLANAFARLVVGALEAQVSVVQAVADIALAIVNSFVNSDFVSTLTQKGRDLIQGLLTGIGEAWPFFQTWAMGLPAAVLASISDMTTTLLQKGSDLLQGLLDGAAAKWPVVQAWLALVGAVAFAAVGDVTKSLWQKGVDLISGVIDGFNDRWEQAKYWLSLVGSYATSNVGDVTNTLKQKGIDLISGLIDGLNNRFEFAKAWLSLVPSQAASAVGYAGSALYDAGVQLISGMVNGVVSMATSLANAVINAVDGAIQAGKDRLNIGSPSKVFYQIGVQTAQGLVLGIGSMEDRVSAAGEAMAAAAVSSYGSEFAGTATSTGGEAAVIHIHNTYALTPADLLRVLQDSETGASFARGFGSELGLYTGQP